MTDRMKLINDKFTFMFPALAKQVGWWSVNKETKNSILLYSKLENGHSSLLYKFTYVDDSKWILESV